MSSTPAEFIYHRNFLLSAADAAGIPHDVLGQRVSNTFKVLTRRLKPTVCLEVGAFEAGFSRWAVKTLPDARVMAFEANPYVYEHFREEVEAAGVDYRNACVGPENGTVEINVPKDYRGTPRKLVNQMASLHTNLSTEEHHQVEVPGYRLDDLVKATDDDVVIAWIDVEGALAMVLGGCTETLRRAAAVYVEVESEPIWDGQWLDTDVVAWFAEIGMVPILRDVQRSIQYNLLFVSQELAADRGIARLASQVYKPLPGAGAPTEAPLPKLRPSRLSRLQGLAQRTLGAQNEELRAQNAELRRRVRRLRRQLNG